MSDTIREDTMSVDEVRVTCHPGDVLDAVAHIEAAEKSLVKLRTEYAEGVSPPVLRALRMVRETLETALEPEDSEE